MRDADDERVDVTFGDGSRHLSGNELSPSPVESAIAQDIIQHLPEIGQSTRRRIEVNETVVEYRAFRVARTRIHIGTYYLA